MFDGVRYRFASAENMNRFQGRSRRLRSGAWLANSLPAFPATPASRIHELLPWNWHRPEPISAAV